MTQDHKIISSNMCMSFFIDFSVQLASEVNSPAIMHFIIVNVMRQVPGLYLTCDIFSSTLIKLIERLQSVS